jgi:hypothetical protein
VFRSSQGFYSVPLWSHNQDGNIDQLFRLHVWIPDDHEQRIPESNIHTHQVFGQGWILTSQGSDHIYEIEPADEKPATHAEYSISWSGANSSSSNKAAQQHQASTIGLHVIMHCPLHARLFTHIRRNSNHYNSINMAPIDKAIEALQRPNPPTQASVSLQYSIKPSTLSRRVRGITTSKIEAYSNKSLLTKPRQLLLVAYINKLCGYGLSPTPAMVRNFAEEIAQKWPRKNWVS